MTNGIIDSNQKIVTNGLVLHLDAAQRRSYSGTGTNWRDLISGTNATLTNGAVFNSSNGGNVSFDGVDDYVDTNRDIQFGATSSFSLESYFYLNSYVNSQLINNESGGYNGYQLSVTDAQQNTIFFSLRVAPGNNIGINFVINSPVQKWTHVLLTYNGSGVASGVKLYADGVLITGVVVSDNLSGTINSGVTTRLGRRVPPSNGPLNGKIGLTRIYNRELSATEILQNYNATKARFEVPALLDLYPNAAAAYSLRKLRSGYTGSAIRVRRSSDNTEQDIGFTSTGELNTTGLTAFVGANNGFVITWYDQSGNNRNATQTTQSNQPQIISAGALILENKKPSLSWYSSSVSLPLSDLSLTRNINNFYSTAVARNNLNTATTGRWIFLHSVNGAGGSRALLGISASLVNYRTGGRRLDADAFQGADSSVVDDLSLKLYTSHLNYGSSDAFLWVNNSLVASNTNFLTDGNTADTLSNGSQIGNSNFNTEGWRGTIQELIHYTSNQSANRIGIETNINSYYGIYNSNIDSDAQSFITAAAITDSTQQGAVDALVKDLKNYGLWTKMKAIYPFVGGTAASHKFNLKDPRDVDGAFRLVFNGGWTHSATGALPDGSTGYANTFLTPSNTLDLNSTHLSYYSKTNNTEQRYQIGVVMPTTWLGISIKYSGNTYSAVNSLTENLFADSSSLGYYLASRINTNSQKIWKNGVVRVTGNVNSTSLATIPIFIGGVNNPNSNYQLSAKECAFATIGDGLTDTEAANLYTAVQKYQTTLGRQV